MAIRRLTIVFASSLLGLGMTASQAQTVVYDAQINILFNNTFLGDQLVIDPDAQVTIAFNGSNFTINEIVFSQPLPPGINGTAELGISGTNPSTGVITEGVATAVINFVGQAVGTNAGTFDLTNEGGTYSGEISGSFFQVGDVLALEANHPGTINPPVGGSAGDWTLLVGTQITFGQPVVQTVAPDFDFDMDVDDTDIQFMWDCWTGPAIPLYAGCEFADLDQDDDVDLADFSVLQRCLSGDGNDAEPTCAD